MNAPEHIAPPSNASAVALLQIAEIVHSLSNPRRHFDGDYLAELAESIKAHGVIQPITVRPISMERMFEYNRRRPAGDEGQPAAQAKVKKPAAKKGKAKADPAPSSTANEAAAPPKTSALTDWPFPVQRA